MSRPKPTIILEYVDKNTFKLEQILDCDAVWAVFYQGKPFNLKSSSSISNYPVPKYKKTSFSNPGHAHNLAKRLNQMFKTKLFEVVKLTKGITVTPDDY
jgi:hypothetical protein